MFICVQYDGNEMDFRLGETIDFIHIDSRPSQIVGSNLAIHDESLLWENDTLKVDHCTLKNYATGYPQLLDTFNIDQYIWSLSYV